jgi:hypothetical protein
MLNRRQILLSVNYKSLFLLGHTAETRSTKFSQHNKTQPTLHLGPIFFMDGTRKLHRPFVPVGYNYENLNFCSFKKVTLYAMDSDEVNNFIINIPFHCAMH